MFKPPGIINETLPTRNKYTNFTNIETTNIAEAASFVVTRSINHVNTSYFNDGKNYYRITNDCFNPYFEGHSHKSFLSLYTIKNSLYSEVSKRLVEDTSIVSVITSRPLNVKINKYDYDINFYCYYVDYLCVSKSQRKKGIAPQIIQTHEYNQRHMNKQIAVSLFKRENELTGIVPLCVYSTYGFSVLKWNKPEELVSTYQLLKITKLNIQLLYDFIKEEANDDFDIIITPHYGNLLKLIETNNVFVYLLKHDDSVMAAYFFRKTAIYVEGDLEILSCFASINRCPSDDVFTHAFKVLFWDISAQNGFGYCTVENISHNYFIVNNLLLKNHPTFISPTAYFFYNFIYKTVSSDKVFIIN